MLALSWFAAEENSTDCRPTRGDRKWGSSDTEYLLVKGLGLVQTQEVVVPPRLALSYSTVSQCCIDTPAP